MNLNEWENVVFVSDIANTLKAVEKKYSLPIFNNCWAVYNWPSQDIKLVVGINSIRTEIVCGRFSGIKMLSSFISPASTLKPGEFFLTVQYEHRDLMVKMLKNHGCLRG